MPDRPTAGEIRAAGAVLWRPAGPGAQVALIHRPRYDDWSFAKGKVDQGEHVLLTAVREVAEETGLPVTLGRRLQHVRYILDGHPKRVDYWVARADSAEARFVANDEVDELVWLALARARARLSYQRDVQTLGEFSAGPRHTVPLILVRHASAGSKSDWPKDDLSRPLDARGLADARMLASLLRCFGAGRVLSSPAERCLATVRKFAARAKVEVEIEAALAVGKGSGKKAARQRLEQIAGECAADDGPVIVCAHRENLQQLLDAACARLGASAPAGPPLRKGGFWVLHRAAGQLAAAERHHPDGR